MESVSKGMNFASGTVQGGFCRGSGTRKFCSGNDTRSFCSRKGTEMGELKMRRNISYSMKDMHGGYFL